MGNNASVLNYSLGSEISSNISYWQLFEGTKQNNDDKSNGASDVTIFKFVKSQNRFSSVAQRGIQKIRLLKHPYVLSYVDSSVSEDSVLLVTEACVPLKNWIDSIGSNRDAINGSISSIHWGFRCIITALEFLHSSCGIGHNAIDLSTIFVVKDGDWKVGRFEYSGNPNNSADESFFRDNFSLVPKGFLPPDVQQNMKIPGSFVLLDMYALGKCMEMIYFEILNVSVSDILRRLINKMVHKDPRHQPSFAQLLRAPEFHGESVQLFIDLKDFSLKSNVESIEILKNVANRVPSLSPSMCVYKILPIVVEKLRIALNDFQNRDSREASRTIVDICMEILSSVSEHGKVTESNFPTSAIDILGSAWSLSDRSIRNSLLKTCKHVVPMLSSTFVNKSIFDPMIAGFADSNAKMREETLKNLIYIVDKLDERHLQDRLLRCITSLQNDNEKSIRTNATIFLGRLASKLKDQSRNRVLPPAFVKAMKDPFVHCRVAGLKAAQACLTLIEPPQIAGILMPQMSILLVDGSADVRSLSLTVLRNCHGILQSFHEHLLSTASAEPTSPCSDPSTPSSSASSSYQTPLKTKDSNQSSSSSLSSSSSVSGGPATSASSVSVGWTSWAVGEISKTIEKVSLEAIKSPSNTSNSIDTSSSIKASVVNKNDGSSNSSMKIISSTSSSISSTSSSSSSISSSSSQKDARHSIKILKPSSSSNWLESADDSININSGSHKGDDSTGNDDVLATSSNGWDDDIKWSDDEDDDRSSVGNSSTTTNKNDKLSISDKKGSIVGSLSLGKSEKGLLSIGTKSSDTTLKKSSSSGWEDDFDVDGDSDDVKSTAKSAEIPLSLSNECFIKPAQSLASKAAKESNQLNMGPSLPKTSNLVVGSNDSSLSGSTSSITAPSLSTRPLSTANSSAPNSLTPSTSSSSVSSTTSSTKATVPNGLSAGSRYSIGIKARKAT